MKHKINALIAMVLITVSTQMSCSNSETSIIKTRDFEKACEYYNITDASKWSLNHSQMQSGEIFPEINIEYAGGRFYYQKVDGDTISLLQFEYFEAIDDTIFYPVEYFKRFEDSSYLQHVILFGENSDTLYYYRTGFFGQMKKKFQRGKYYYQYKYGKLCFEEYEFFELHKDSLIAIRGNLLPKLGVLNLNKDSLNAINSNDSAEQFKSFLIKVE